MQHGSVINVFVFCTLLAPRAGREAAIVKKLVEMKMKMVIGHVPSAECCTPDKKYRVLIFATVEKLKILLLIIGLSHILAVDRVINR
mmetsp:Transcript_23047/g.29438  ORF Transcript_23047/g.29438 Transcript_23047/m.29438 type:complete len:87 (+) Transcript_23047:352-612(+)